VVRLSETDQRRQQLLGAEVNDGLVTAELDEVILFVAYLHPVHFVKGVPKSQRLQIAAARLVWPLAAQQVDSKRVAEVGVVCRVSHGNFMEHRAVLNRRVQDRLQALHHAVLRGHARSCPEQKARLCSDVAHHVHVLRATVAHLQPEGCRRHTRALEARRDDEGIPRVLQCSTEPHGMTLDHFDNAIGKRLDLATECER